MFKNFMTDDQCLYCRHLCTFLSVLFLFGLIRMKFEFSISNNISAVNNDKKNISRLLCVSFVIWSLWKRNKKCVNYFNFPYGTEVSEEKCFLCSGKFWILAFKIFVFDQKYIYVVIFWSLFISETSEKSHNSTFGVKI